MNMPIQKFHGDEIKTNDKSKVLLWESDCLTKFDIVIGSVGVGWYISVFALHLVSTHIEY